MSPEQELNACKLKLALIRVSCEWTLNNSTHEIARLMAQDFLDLIGEIK